MPYPGSEEYDEEYTVYRQYLPCPECFCEMPYNGDICTVCEEIEFLENIADNL